MGIKIFYKAEKPTAERETVKVWQVMDTPEVPHLSMSIMFKKSCPEGYVSKSDNIDMAYMVVSGEGYVESGGKKTDLKRGDVVYIPKGTGYIISDGLEVVAACTPRFGSQS